MQLGEEWVEYYDMFPYFSHEKIRRGCHPWKMIHPDSERVIVLVHGLSDSPYYMHALARFFHEQLSYSVFIPLLHCHGLEEPDGMRGVSLSEWKKNVAKSIEAAGQFGEVSIGGLSTGATLGIYIVEEMDQFKGSVYLFSAAFAFAGGIIGRFKEWIVRTPIVGLLRYFDRNKSLIGPHPYRYAYVDRGAARELSCLIKEISPIIAKYNSSRPYRYYVFAVHHQTDKVVSFAAVQDFINRVPKSRYEFLQIPDEIGVAHAGVVLHEDIYLPDNNGEILEKANPLFPQLIARIMEMEKKMAAVGTL